MKTLPLLSVVTAIVVLLLSLNSGASVEPARAATTQVGMWDQFEAPVTNGRTYSNPFTDVSLDVVYTRPDGSTVSFWGFYDSGTTWKIRFMCEQEGV